MEDKMPVTRAGFERMKEELKRLKTTERRDVAREIEIASKSWRSQGECRLRRRQGEAVCSKRTFALSRISSLAPM